MISARRAENGTSKRELSTTLKKNQEQECRVNVKLSYLILGCVLLLYFFCPRVGALIKARSGNGWSQKGWAGGLENSRGSSTLVPAPSGRRDAALERLEGPAHQVNAGERQAVSNQIHPSAPTMQPHTQASAVDRRFQESRPLRTGPFRNQVFMLSFGCGSQLIN